MGSFLSQPTYGQFKILNTEDTVKQAFFEVYGFYPVANQVIQARWGKVFLTSREIVSLTLSVKNIVRTIRVSGLTVRIDDQNIECDNAEELRALLKRIFLGNKV